MKSRIGLALLLIVCTVWEAPASAQTTTPVELTPPPGTIRRVIIVSVDGLMPSTYISPDAHGLQIPTLREMVRHGGWSEGTRSVFPTVTYPAHTSIATGANPGTHGIVSNLAWDPFGRNDRVWRWYAEDIRAPTLWDAARNRGLRTAMVWWPATVGAQATAVLPEILRSSTEDNVKLLRALATPGLLDAVAKRFPNFTADFTPPNLKDESLADIAVHLIETQQPHLLMLHMFQVDRQQHLHGPLSAAALPAIENSDRQIARLITAAKEAGVWNETVLVVVSDHGFARISQRVRPGVLLLEKNLVTLDRRQRVTDWKASVAAGGGYAYVYVKDPKDAETQKTLLETLPPLAGKPGSGIRRVYTQKEIRDKGGDPSAFLALEGDDGFAIIEGYWGDYLSPSPSTGAHGYDPERPEMLASLLVYGPAIAPGKIERARLIDVAPTIARWLDLKLDKAEGLPLPIGLRTLPR
jgi:predicted AlkP superfamily pyrophosphatase or phosphodiesterase